MFAKKELAIFIAVGAAAALLHLSIVWLVVTFANLTPLKANVIGFLGALNISYFGHSKFTFNHAKTNTLRTFSQFATISVTGFTVNQIAYFYGLKWFGETLYLPILMAILILVAFFTYAFSKLWVFAKSEPTNQ